jgi:hypothetical protein
MIYAKVILKTILSLTYMKIIQIMDNNPYFKLVVFPRVCVH